MLRIALGLIGFTATMAQILLLRELLVVFSGNEISLGVILAGWLIWIAVGCGVIARVVLKLSAPLRALVVLQLSTAIVLPGTIIVARLLRVLLGAVPGETLGPGTMFTSSLVVLSLFCSISGITFAVGSRLYSQTHGVSTGEGSSVVYRLEAIGSGIGGIIASLILIPLLSNIQIALLLSLLNAAVACALVIPDLFRRRSFWVAATAAALLLAPLAEFLNTASTRFLWGDLTLLVAKDSRHGNIVITEAGESRSLYVNGLVAFTAPDPEAAEEAVHYALLQHPAPASLLLIGGGLNGSLMQATQHKSLDKIDYVELDPEILVMAKRYFPTTYPAGSAGQIISMHEMDGRLFLRNTAQIYDVIIVALPDPYTAQLNRFYTQEFFEEAERKLKRSGVLSFQVTAAENYVSGELAAFLGSLHRTASLVFSEIVVFPGSRAHFFCANRPLTADSDVLMERLRARELQTQYVREYYLPFRLMPDRLLDLEQQIRSVEDDRFNRDLEPIAFYFDMILWSTRFHSWYQRVLQAVEKPGFAGIVVAVATLSILGAFIQLQRRRKTSTDRGAACYAVWAMGFTLLTLEFFLLLGFQAIYGYVYSQLALLIATFMIGIGIGSWHALKVVSKTRTYTGGRDHLSILGLLQIAAAFSVLLLYGVFSLLGSIEARLIATIASSLLFPLLSFFSGYLGGFQFPLASVVYFGLKETLEENPGLLYGLDLLGALTASLLMSVFLFPAYGMGKSALLVVVINLGPLILISLALNRRNKT